MHWLCTSIDLALDPSATHIFHLPSSCRIYLQKTTHFTTYLPFCLGRSAKQMDEAGSGGRVRPRIFRNNRTLADCEVLCPWLFLRSNTDTSCTPHDESNYSARPRLVFRLNSSVYQVVVSSCPCIHEIGKTVRWGCLFGKQNC